MRNLILHYISSLIFLFGNLFWIIPKLNPDDIITWILAVIVWVLTTLVTSFLMFCIISFIISEESLPIIFSPFIYLSLRFPKVKPLNGNTLKNVYLFYSDRELWVFELNLFYIIDIKSPIEYNKESNIQELLNEELEDYINKRLDKIDQMKNVSEWDGFLLDKDRRNNTIKSIIDKKK